MTCFKGSLSSLTFRGLKGAVAQRTPGVRRGTMTKDSLRVLATCTLPGPTLEAQLGVHDRSSGEIPGVV